MCAPDGLALLRRLTDWIEVTSPQSVRNHLAAIGRALVARYS